MNLANLPTQLFAIFLGWLFTLWLQQRANIKSEAIRKKDKLIDRVDKLADWAEKNTPVDMEDGALAEEIYSAMVSQIEIRTQNLYILLGDRNEPLGMLAELRGVDIIDAGGHKENIKLLRITVISLIEVLELACDSRYFSKKTMRENIEHYARSDLLYNSLTALFVAFVVFVFAKMLLL